MKPMSLYLAGTFLILLAGPVFGQQHTQSRTSPFPPLELVMGRTAKLGIAQGGISGELLSVSMDSLWVLSEERVQGLALTDLRKVDVQMHRFGAGRVLAWNLVAGLGSAIALTAACTSVADSCGGVFVGWSLTWALVGGISGAALASSSHRLVTPSPEALRPYVRYPQGFPKEIKPGGKPIWPGG